MSFHNGQLSPDAQAHLEQLNAELDHDSPGPDEPTKKIKAIEVMCGVMIIHYENGPPDVNVAGVNLASTMGYSSQPRISEIP